MKYKFLFLAVIIAATTLNVNAENISAGVQQYYEIEKNLTDINSRIDALNTDIDSAEKDISALNDEKNILAADIEEESAEIIEKENTISNTKKEIENTKIKSSEFDTDKGTGYKIGNMMPAFIIGLWISIIILIFVWRGE